MNPEITAMLAALPKKEKKLKPSIPVSDAAKNRYIYQHHQYQSGKVPNAVADHGNTKCNLPRMDSNGLNRFMVDYIIWCGGNAKRINIIGRKVDGVWRKGSSTRSGAADVSATLPGGLRVELEGKILNDRPSTFQLNEQRKERAAGGIYEFIKTPEQFLELFDKLTNNKFKTEPDRTTGVLDMNQLFTGSICLSDLMDKAKAKHSAFSRAQNGKVYVNMLVWQNEQPDKFGNTLSLQLNSSKDMKDSEGKFYIGNAKPLEKQGAQPVTHKDAEEFMDDLPF